MFRIPLLIRYFKKGRHNWKVLPCSKQKNPFDVIQVRVHTPGRKCCVYILHLLDASRGHFSSWLLFPVYLTTTGRIQETVAPANICNATFVQLRTSWRQKLIVRSLAWLLLAVDVALRIFHQVWRLWHQFWLSQVVLFYILQSRIKLFLLSSEN